MSGPLLSVEGLRTHFFVDAGVVKAVDGVSFEVQRGEGQQRLLGDGGRELGVPAQGRARVGVPDEQYGEEVKAFVVPAAGANPEPEAIVAWARERLAGYKYPRIVELRESLPLGATGKILKRDLN